MKFFGTQTHSFITKSCFHTTVTELSSYKRRYSLQRQKYLIQNSWLACALNYSDILFFHSQASNAGKMAASAPVPYPFSFLFIKEEQVQFPDWSNKASALSLADPDRPALGSLWTVAGPSPMLHFWNLERGWLYLRYMAWCWKRVVHHKKYLKIL